MALIRNIQADVYKANTISIKWNQPINYNNSNDEIIITRATSHFPVELYNSAFPTKATDSRPVEIFRAKTIVGTNTGTISVLGNILTDTSASLPVSPPLNGRLLRDSSSKVHRILSNTATTITLETAPSNGKYVILPDFPNEIRALENYEIDVRTSVGSGFIKDLVIIENNSLIIKEFEQDELANLIFKDGSNNRFIIKNNTSDTIYFFETASTPSIGSGMALLNSFSDSQPLPYIDNFKTEQEANNRSGSYLRNNVHYYYTGFTKPENTNVAQVSFSLIDSGISTQTYSISPEDKEFGTLIYNLWPSLYRELDSSGDLEDLMNVFGQHFNTLHSYIATYRLQDSENLVVKALQPLSEQTGLPSVGFSIGADTLRRVAKDLIACWKLKGSKEGIALFIRVLTTWDITDGTGDYSSAILDFLPNMEALRFFDLNLGTTNTRLTQTDPFVAGGRFLKTLPGIVIPGFFTFREFVVTIPNVALYIGISENFNISNDTTTMTDSTQNFGAIDSLVGNYLLPNQEEVNDLFQITGNTATTITVRGVVNNLVPGGDYAILSPLNTNRFIILNKMMPLYQPYGTKAGWQFT